MAFHLYPTDVAYITINEHSSHLLLIIYAFCLETEPACGSQPRGLSRWPPYKYIASDPRLPEAIYRLSESTYLGMDQNEVYTDECVITFFVQYGEVIYTRGAPSFDVVKSLLLSICTVRGGRSTLLASVSCVWRGGYGPRQMYLMAIRSQRQLNQNHFRTWKSSLNTIESLEREEVRSG